MRLELKEIDESNKSSILNNIERRLDNLEKLQNIEKYNDEELWDIVSEIYQFKYFNDLDDAREFFLPERGVLTSIPTNMFDYFDEYSRSRHHYLRLTIVCRLEFFNYLEKYNNNIIFNFNTIEKYIKEQLIVVINAEKDYEKVNSDDLFHSYNYLTRYISADKLVFQKAYYFPSVLREGKPYYWYAMWQPTILKEDNPYNRLRLYKLLFPNNRFQNPRLYRNFYITFIKYVLTTEKVERDTEEAVENIQKTINWYYYNRTQEDEERIKKINERLTKIESKYKDSRIVLKNLEHIHYNTDSLSDQISILYSFCNFKSIYGDSNKYIEYANFCIIYETFIDIFYRRRAIKINRGKYFYEHREKIEEELQEKVKEDIPIIAEKLKQALLELKDAYTYYDKGELYQKLLSYLDYCKKEEPYILKRVYHK